MTKVSLTRHARPHPGSRSGNRPTQCQPGTRQGSHPQTDLNSADVTPGSTHINSLRALVDNFKEVGAACITLAERSASDDPTRAVLGKRGITELVEELGFDIPNLQQMDGDGLIDVRPEGSHWTDGCRSPHVYADDSQSS